MTAEAAANETTAWVSRSNPNPDSQATKIELGNDLLRLDPKTMERTGDRIDLSSFNTTAMRMNPDTGKEEVVEVFARPSSIVKLSSALVVGLGRVSLDLATHAAGVLAVIELGQEKAKGLELEGLYGCGTVVPVPESEDTVLVGCSGTGADRAATAGLLLVRVTDGKAKIVESWLGKDHEDDLLTVQRPVSLGGTLVGGVIYGASAGDMTKAVPDRFALIDLKSGRQELLFESEIHFAIGAGVFDASTKLLLVPDGSTTEDGRPTAGIRRFQIDSLTKSKELDVVPVAEDSELPVRSIHFL